MRTEFLVGYTGFVGSNLARQHKFSALFNSKNICDAYGKKPELLVYSGVKSEMFLANKDPEADLQLIIDASKNIEKIIPKKLVLISTIAVYPRTDNANEDTFICKDELTAYGANRLYLERWVEENIGDYLIVRLPAIYGENLKKNFIYDYIHIIPTMLTSTKYGELISKNRELEEYYELQKNGFYKCKNLTIEEEKRLRILFLSLGFTALSFTDSRSIYQFYDLKNLWNHIQIALDYGISKLNISTPPISASEVYRELSGKQFVNELEKPPYNYDIHTKFFELFGGVDGYIMTKEQEMEEIVNFVRKREGI